MYYLYILYAPAVDKFYVGISKDGFNRLEIHNTTDRNTFTRKYRPWDLAALFECANTLGEARKTENYIKRQKSRKLILQLINPAFVPFGALALPIIIGMLESRTSGINQRVVP